uniref:C2H2-type domain-containing protein n=1 Tax=Oryzias latipes TaxID=8090 RepID=A0A3P9H4E9_ORYLA
SEETGGRSHQEGSDGEAESKIMQELNGCAQLQSAGSLKVTIQRSSESREFGQPGRGAEKKTPGLRCHVCDLCCHSLQMFQEHMSGGEHLRRLQEVTSRIRSYTLDRRVFVDPQCSVFVFLSPCRGRQTQPQRWCDTCQTRYTGNVIVHRRTKRHKVCKQRGRPFCPVCKRHFRTPRKFVEHMKSAEHKQQVSRGDSHNEEELITLDAVGCFEEEEEVEVADEGQQGDEEESKEEHLQVGSVCGSERAPTCDQVVFFAGGSFVVPVCGFVCRLCKKFFYRETEARHSHCRTHAHFQNLQVTPTVELWPLSGGRRECSQTAPHGGRENRKEDQVVEATE